MDTVTRLDSNQVLLTDKISLTRYIKLLEVYLRGLEIIEEVLAEMQLIKGTGDEAEHMDFLEEREFKNHYFSLGSESSIGTLPSDFFPYTGEAAKAIANEIKISLKKRREQLQAVIQKGGNEEVENVNYRVECDDEWDAELEAEWEHMMSFYSDDLEEWETPDFLTSKVTGEVFCTLEGYARLSRLSLETVFKRTNVINGNKRFNNMQEIDLGDEEVKIIPLTEVAKWIVGDNPCVAKLLIGDDDTIQSANFINQLRHQKALDIEPQTKLPSKVKSIPLTKPIPVQSQPDSGNKSVEGTVYLIGNRENNTLKIGFSENSVRTRLAAFQVSCAHRLEIIKTKKGNLQDERKLLEKFKEFNIRREWFRWDDSIINGFDENDK